MKVETKKKIIIVATGVCLAALSFIFLFQVFGPYEEKVTMWLPSNYEIMNETNSLGEAIPTIPQTEDEENYLVMPMHQFKKFFGKSKDKAKISIICDKSGINYDIIYQITCQATDKNNFIIKSTDSHNHGRKHFLKPVRLDQKTGIFLLECERDWSTISFFLAFILLAICFIAIIFCPINGNPDGFY